MTSAQNIKTSSRNKAILVIYGKTPIHPGSATSVSYIDLPIQRERITNFPIIQGSSLKGALRSKFRALNSSPDKMFIIFGPGKDLKGPSTTKDQNDKEINDEIPYDDPSFSAGALSVSDARLLLFPVRSLAGVFAWITCPLILRRLARSLSHFPIFQLPNVPTSIQDSEIYLPEGHKSSSEWKSIIQINESNEVVLEEFTFTTKSSDLVNKWGKIIEDLLPSDDPLVRTFRSRFGIVSDDTFRDFVTMATEIVERIQIDPVTGTVSKTGGNLWNEEFLPAETVLWSDVYVSIPSIMKEKMKKSIIETEEHVINILRRQLDGEALHLGGEYSIGRGFAILSVRPK